MVESSERIVGEEAEAMMFAWFAFRLIRCNHPD
jgi:hypothetical protein